VHANSVAFCYFGLRLKRTRRCRRSTVTHVSEELTDEVIWIEENTTVLSRKLLFTFPQSEELFSTVHYLLQVNIQCLITENFTLNFNPSFNGNELLYFFSSSYLYFLMSYGCRKDGHTGYPVTSTERVLPQKPNEPIPDVRLFFSPTANRADFIY